MPSHEIYISDAGLNAPRLWYSILVRRMLIGEQGVKVYMIYTSDCCHLCYIWMLLTLCAFVVLASGLGICELSDGRSGAWFRAHSDKKARAAAAQSWQTDDGQALHTVVPGRVRTG